MGRLLRRYWHPVAALSSLANQPVRSVRLLGEDLVLFRANNGTLGLVEPRCAHRGARLDLGYTDACGLRCAYHGWLYDQQGQCLDTPLEPPTSTLKQRARVKSYPATALGGLVFAYLGQAPAPPLPRWDLLVWPNSIRQIVQCEVACNWLQCTENAADLLHTLILHGDAFRERLQRAGTWNPYLYPRVAEFTDLHQPPPLRWETFAHGVRLKLPGSPPAGHALLFPNIGWKGGSSIRQEMQFKVPIDDTHTLQLSLLVYTPPKGVTAPPQASIPVADLSGRQLDFVDNILTQDIKIWESQGEVADRSQELLGASDAGVLAFRKLLKAQLAANAAGDPLCNVLAQPSACIEVGRRPGSYETNPLEELTHGFERYYGDKYGGANDLIRTMLVDAIEPHHGVAYIEATLGPVLASVGSQLTGSVAISLGIEPKQLPPIYLRGEQPFVTATKPTPAPTCSLQVEAEQLQFLLAALIADNGEAMAGLVAESKVQLGGDPEVLAPLRGWQPPPRTKAERLRQAGSLVVNREPPAHRK